MPHASAADRKKYARAYYLANREKINADFKAWRGRNQEKRAAYEKAYYAANKGKARAQRIEKLYGLSAAEYAALLDGQDGVCAICKKPPTKKSRQETSLHVDHCHETGEVRGLLCLRCNVALGMLRDDPSIVGKLLAYAKRAKLRRVA